MIFLQATDSGEYVCEVATGQEEIPSLIHTVTVIKGEYGYKDSPHTEDVWEQAAVTAGAGAATMSLVLLSAWRLVI